MPKNSKEAIQAHSTFLQTENHKKNARGYPLTEFENFRKKVAYCRKKPKGETLCSRLYFWKPKKIVA